MHNDREKLIEEVCEKVNDILDQCKNWCYPDNQAYLVSYEENLVFHLRVLHYLANPNDKEDKVSAIYKRLQKNLEELNPFLSKGTLYYASLNKIHWENLLSVLVIKTYPSFVRK